MSPSTNAPLRCCLAACFLPLDATTRDWLCLLRVELQQHGLHLVLLTSHEDSPSELTSLRVPFLLRDFASRTEDHVDLEILPERERYLVSLDALWSGEAAPSPAHHARGLQAAESCFNALLRMLNPACVLTWGSSLAQSRLLAHLARSQAIPTFVLERGLLPDTLMVDLLGHSGLSDLNLTLLGYTSPDHATVAHHADCSYERAKHYFLHDASHKYAQGSALNREDCCERLKAKHLIAFFGHNDVATGMLPRDNRESSLHSPAFASTHEALLALDEALHGLPDVGIVFKPHPRDTTDYSDLVGEHIMLTQNVNLRSLATVADVHASMLSTSQFELLWFEKPLLLLARSQLAGKGVAYEVRHRSEIRCQLECAFSQPDREHKLARRRAFLLHVLNHYLVGIHERVPTRLRLADLAAFLAENAGQQTPTQQGLDWIEQCARTGGWHCEALALTNGAFIPPNSCFSPSIALTDEAAGYREQALLHFNHGNHDAARQCLNDALRCAPFDSASLQCLVLLEMECGNLQAAAAACDLWAKYEPGTPLVHVHKAMILVHQDHLQEAYASVAEALQIDPNHQQAHTLRAALEQRLRIPLPGSRQAAGSACSTPMPTKVSSGPSMRPLSRLNESLKLNAHLPSPMVVVPQKLNGHSPTTSQCPDQIPTKVLSLEHLGGCPSCNHRQYSKVFEHQDGSMTLRLHKCESCGLVFMNPRLSTAAIKDVEEVNTFYAYTPEVMREEVKKRVDLVLSFQRFKRPPGRMIDIGCSRGLLLEAARLTGWEPFGLDISSASVAQVRRDFGLPASCEPLDLFHPSQPFDLCVAWHVFEHCTEPRAFARNLYRLLACNGLLALQVPCFNRLTDFVAQKRLPSLVNKVHNLHFTRQSLSQILSDTGFQILELIEGHDLMLTAFARRPA